MNKTLLVTSVTVLLTSGMLLLARQYRHGSQTTPVERQRLLRDNLFAMSKGATRPH